MQQWVDCEFTGRDFRDEDLSRLHTERAMFSECDFSGVNLAESQHRGSAFRNCTFERTTLWHSTFAQCSMLGSVFVACRLRPLTLDDVDFTLAVLGGNDLRGLNLTGCRLRETSLVDTDLRKCVLRGADLSGARTTAPGWMTRLAGRDRGPGIVADRVVGGCACRRRPSRGLCGGARAVLGRGLDR